ncbi:aminotransferase class I/II-fold pyridoxal phosphate-dependent enzyme [Rhodococcus baikonurensis]|uniref:aminotransferase class I/II-fold pyridoxal phosphate-dependent enzyme n=1 Tax=Rhodococcus baikonurensis TaxID=172041 RepID=UPI0037936692
MCWCANNHVLFVSDEIYHGVSFGEPSHSAWEFSTKPIVIKSFSKFWCMTGWRLGWMLAPAGLLDAIDALIGNMSLCPPAQPSTLRCTHSPTRRCNPTSKCIGANGISY